MTIRSVAFRLVNLFHDMHIESGTSFKASRQETHFKLNSKAWKAELN